MKHAIEVVKVMTPFPHTIDSSASVAEAEVMLKEHFGSFLTVTENEEPVGVITARDIRISQKLCSDRNKSDIHLTDLTLRQPVVVETTEHVATVVSRMIRDKLQAVVVVKRGRVVGTFTYTNAYEMLVKLLTGSFTLHNPPDLTA